MYFLTLLALTTAPFAAQVNGPITGQLGISPRPRPAIATVEGPPFAQAVGLFDVRTGAFAAGRLDPQVQGLVGFELLPIDHVGRSELTARLPDTPRLRADVGAASRLELPHANGTLYHYRVGVGAQRVYGFIHVGSDGVPRVAFERPALGNGGVPFLPRLSVDQDGLGVLVATVRAAGGDLIELDLERRTAVDRTPNSAPLTFGEDGLWLGSTWGFGVARDAVYRFSRTPGAAAAVIPVTGGAPLAWRGDAAMSPSRNAAIAIGGFGPGSLVPYVFDAQGPARPAAAAPARIASAGYAPASTFGPFLAVSDDAATCAWCVDLNDLVTQLPFRDVVLGRAGATFDPVVVTGDPFLLDTLDEVGRVFFLRIGELLYAAGEPNDPTEGGMESADVFGALLGATGTPSLRNVSGTSGDTTVPFTSGIPVWTPAFIGLVEEGVALIHDDDARQLVVFDLVSGTHSVVLPSVREVLWLERAGPAGAWCAAVERDTQMREMQVVGADAPLGFVRILDSGTASTEYLAQVVPRTGDAPIVGYVRRDFGLDRVLVSLLTTGQTQVWSTVASSVTPPLAFVGPRRLAFSRLAGAGGNEQRIWSFFGGQDFVLQAPPRASSIFP